MDSIGHKIIIITTRKESERQITVKQQKFAIYDYLIMGGHGSRTMINDKLILKRQGVTVVNVITDKGLNQLTGRNLVMKVYKLADMDEAGLGRFYPTAYKTKDFEVNYRTHIAGEQWKLIIMQNNRNKPSCEGKMKFNDVLERWRYFHGTMATVIQSFLKIQQLCVRTLR